MTILELREKRNTAWNTAKAFLDSHRNEKGVLNAEDDATYSRMEQEITDLGKEISRLERQEALERELSAPTATPITHKPEAMKRDEKTGRASDAYKGAFWNQMRNKTSIDVRNALSEGVDTEGGYLVPETFENTLVQALRNELVFRQLAHVITTSSSVHRIPVVATKGSASWVEENKAIPETADTFAQQSLGSHKLAALIKISEELLSDSAFDLENYFKIEYAARIADAEEEAFINGDGNGKPYGILHDSEGAETGATASSATAISADDVINLYYSLRAPYRKRGVWIMNDTTISALRKLKDANGQYMWQPSLREGDPDMFLGKPVYTSLCMPSIAAGAKAIAFGDLSNYWIGDRAGVAFRRLNELYAANGQVGFLATKRLDGKLILPEAVKVLQMKKTSGSAS